MEAGHQEQCRSFKQSSATFHRIETFGILTPLGLNGRGRFVINTVSPAGAPDVLVLSTMMTYFPNVIISLLCAQLMKRS